jgi:hypothetical protein
VTALEQWVEEHVGVSIEIAGAPWTVKAVVNGRAVLREDGPPGVSVDRLRARTVSLASVRQTYLRQYAAQSGGEA